MAKQLEWEVALSGEVLMLLQAVSDADGVCSFMFGGHGHYYKISWSIGGRHDFISAEEPERLSELAGAAVLRGLATKGHTDGPVVAWGRRHHSDR